MLKKFILILSIIILLTGCSNTSGHDSSEEIFLSLQNQSPIPVAREVEKPKTDSENKPTVDERGNYIPINYDEQKAVWFSYIDIADMLTNKSEAQFRKNISDSFDRVRGLGINTVYAHVRPFGDALYQSNHFPQSRYYNGVSGKGSSYDALKIMTEQAHQKGLSIHAWINPLRCEKPENIEKISDDFLIKKWFTNTDYYGKYIVKVENSEQLWLNPAYQEVVDLICNGVEELCLNYNIDGIHIDDYFYPTTDEGFDKQAFDNSKSASISDFRISSTNKLVKQMYSTIKQVNSRIMFGISPQGSFNNNYNQLFADVKTWITEVGYCDYIVPQVYYGYNNEVEPYLEVIKSWSELTNDNVKLIIGLAHYKIYNEEEYKNNTGIISKQILDAKKLEDYGGVALYNYKNIFQESERSLSERKAVAEQLKK
ncbi:MAG: family 10 glycosylhydrolase [Clostridiales bacterium]|nr:family 10 glycosylhydrolase [Clostridiales bacterium]